MKIKYLVYFSIVIILSVFIFENSFQQTKEDLNGSRFIGKAEEQTPPDVERMPIVMDEVILFDSGNIRSEVMKKYSMSECSYSAEIDERRMIAVKVVNYNSECQGIYNGENVTMKIKGSIFGDLWLSGEIIIIRQDNSEIKFDITAEAE